MKGRLTIYIAVILSTVLSFQPCLGTLNLASGIENPMPVRYPELLTAPAPPWLAEGMRATYTVIASSSTTEHLENKNLMSGDVGNGVIQLDIVALDNGKAAIFKSTYVPGPGVQGALRQNYRLGSVAPVGCGDFWCSPDILKRIPIQADNSGLTVQRLPLTIEGINYQTIRFDFIDNDLQLALVYDLDTGILLYHTFDYLSYNPAGPNQVPTSGGNSAQLVFHNLRQLKIPWKEGAMPDSFAAGQRMSYQGQIAIQIQGASPTLIPLTLQYTVLSASERYAELKYELYDQSTGSSTILGVVSGTAQLMGNWISPNAIANLSPGVIDTDPYTNMKVSVVRNDDSGAVLERTNQQDYRELYHYSPDGILMETYQEYNPDVLSSGFGSVKTITLQLVG